MRIVKSFYWIGGAAYLCTSMALAQTKASDKKDAPKAGQTSPGSTGLTWPLPPEQPRVRWLAEYRDMAKVKGPAASRRGWLDRVTGTKTPEEKQELRKPYGITTDSRGRIYAADTELKAVFVIDPAAKTVDRRQGSTVAPMAVPAGVAVDAQDRLFVSDAQLRSITCFTAAGNVVSRFGTASLGRPGGIAIDAQRGRLYVADAKENRIAVFDIRNFGLIGFYGKPGKPGRPEPGTLASPTNVAVDPQGNLYIADTLNFRVQIFSPEGKFVRAFGTQGDRPGEFIRPKGIAVDSEGHIYVADAEFNNFQILSQEGRPLLAVGMLGSGPGEFALIAGLHIDSKDRIYTTEMYVGRIQVFQYIKQPAAAEGKGVVQAADR